VGRIARRLRRGGLSCCPDIIYKRGVPPGVAYLVCALIAVLALVYQGSLGSMMVFGK